MIALFSMPLQEGPSHHQKCCRTVPGPLWVGPCSGVARGGLPPPDEPLHSPHQSHHPTGTFCQKTAPLKGSKNETNNNFVPVLEFTISIQPPSEEPLPEASSPEENEVKFFMVSYVSALFANSGGIIQEQKSAFGKHVRSQLGQTWFARVITAQRVRRRCVSESTFYSLVQHFAIVLFECSNSDYFPPAKTLMNMCFTFYHEVQVPGCEPFREYLSTYLRNQPIWRSLRFWNASYFDALETARNYKPVLTQTEIMGSDNETVMDDKQYQENIAFGQLGTFICNMHAFGLEKKLCEEFLQNQLVIASLPSAQEKMLQEHLNYLYDQTDPYS